MNPKFVLPEWAKPWAGKIATALLLAGVTAIVVWLRTNGIEAKLPAIEAQVQSARDELKAARDEIQEIKKLGTLFIEKK